MKYQTSDQHQIADIEYFTECSGDAPISVYIIHGTDGDMLIDTGFRTTYQPLLQWIHRHHFTIKDIFITHAHPDHDWNAAQFKRMFGARIWLSENDIPLISHFGNQPQFPTEKRFAARTKWISFWTKTPLFHSETYTPDVVITGDDPEIGKRYGYDVAVVTLSGHTLGSVGILRDNVLYAGDAYTVMNGVPMLPPHAASVEKMLASYQKIAGIAPEYLACGHGLPFQFNHTYQNKENG